MILPNKIIYTENSLFYFGTIVISVMAALEYDIDTLYSDVNKVTNIDFDDFLYTLDFLFLINCLEYNNETNKLNLLKSKV